MAAPRRGAIPARLALATGLAGALAIGLIAALSPSPAQAGCPICDEYTLDIPDPTNGHGGSNFDPGSEPAPEPEAPSPAPVPAAPAPTATLPAAAATSSNDSSDKEQKPKHGAAPAEPFVPVRVDGPPEAARLTSVPLSYEGEDSAPGAALAGLGSPGTIALLAALIAAGAAIAVGRRRATAR